MKMRQLLLGSLGIGAGLAATRYLFGKTASSKPASSSTSFDAIDAYVEGQMHRLNIPGVSLAIVEGDKIVHLRGFGQARPDGEAPSPQTPFSYEPQLYLAGHSQAERSGGGPSILVLIPTRPNFKRESGDLTQRRTFQKR